MKLTQALRDIRYVVDSDGRRTDAVIPLKAWRALLTAWTKSLEKLEDQEDQAVLVKWLQQRAAGEADMMPLEQLERELLADGLL